MPWARVAVMVLISVSREPDPVPPGVLACRAVLTDCMITWQSRLLGAYHGLGFYHQCGVTHRSVRPLIADSHLTLSLSSQCHGRQSSRSDSIDVPITSRRDVITYIFPSAISCQSGQLVNHYPIP